VNRGGGAVEPGAVVSGAVVAGTVASGVVVSGAAVVAGVAVVAGATAVDAGAAASSPQAVTVAIDPMTNARTTIFWRFMCQNIAVSVNLAQPVEEADVSRGSQPSGAS
jgi:hypothetical protein